MDPDFTTVYEVFRQGAWQNFINNSIVGQWKARLLSCHLIWSTPPLCTVHSDYQDDGSVPAFEKLLSGRVMERTPGHDAEGNWLLGAQSQLIHLHNAADIQGSGNIKE
ncbi:hypothetical protein STEG23_029962, partial [Scotinomys teguina]